MSFPLLHSAHPGRIPSFVYGIVGVTAFLVVLFLFARGPAPQDTGLVLYWGIGCPHCEKVEEFIRQNQVEKTLQITKKEVYNDQKNTYEMGRHAGECGLPSDTIAVPFLWTGEKCLIGDIDIIRYLQLAMGADSSGTPR
ncbi:MAG: hypothetical protein PHS73_04370 [Candidatus Peribacteraceae bacterium]|nr:hypothetical protein [Candidatus Peribacteraceae bacterium]